MTITAKHHHWPVTICLAAFMLFSLVSTSRAQEGRVLATCSLSNIAHFRVFGQDVRIDEIQWRINSDETYSAGLRKIQLSDPHNRQYALLDGNALNPKAGIRTDAGHGEMQIANARTLGTIRLKNKGRFSMFGRSAAFQEIEWKTADHRQEKPQYVLVKKGNTIRIAHAGIPPKKEVVPGETDLFLAVK